MFQRDRALMVQENSLRLYTSSTNKKNQGEGITHFTTNVYYEKTSGGWKTYFPELNTIQNKGL